MIAVICSSISAFVVFIFGSKIRRRREMQDANR